MPRATEKETAKAKSWYAIKASSEDETLVMIYDDIGYFGVNARDFLDKLSAIKTPKISLHINSYGGEAFDAFAIYNGIKNHPATVTVHIDGIAASAASVIALAGDTVCIAKNAYLMIHNVIVGCYGNADYLRKQADVIDKMSATIAQTYADKSGQSIEDVKKALDAETWFNAQEAKDFGLVDEIDSDSDDDEEMPEAMARALLKFNKAPENIRKIAAKFIDTQKQNRGADVPPTHTLTPPKKEPTVAEKITSREGKHFVKVGETEVEVEMPAATVPPPHNALTPEAAASAAVTQERAYRKEFMAALESSGLKGDPAKTFEEKFYGKDIEAVKFIASNSIASRATAVGESSEKEGEGNAAKPVDAEKKKLNAEQALRFKNDAHLRQMWNLRGNEAEESDAYKNALGRFLTQQAKYANVKTLTDEELKAAR